MGKITRCGRERYIAMFYTDQPPDRMFYRDLAYEKLNNQQKAKSCFNKSINYGEEYITANVKIDFFALQLDANHQGAIAHIKLCRDK